MWMWWENNPGGAYCIQGYFCHLLYSPFLTFKWFRPVLESPRQSWVHFKHWNLPSFKFAIWQQGHKGQIKTEANNFPTYSISIFKPCTCIYMFIGYILLLQPKPSMVVSPVYLTLVNTDSCSPGMVSQCLCGILVCILKKENFYYLIQVHHYM